MKKTKFSILIIAVAMMTSMTTFAAHPAYLKALADMRAARWMVNHRPAADWRQSKEEAMAIKEIDEAIGEIHKAAIDDHKNVDDHAGVQEIPDRGGRLRKAIELLRATRADIAKGEDDKFGNGLRARAFGHIDEAIKNLERAMASK